MSGIPTADQQRTVAQEQAQGWLDEASGLRAFPPPSAAAGPGELHDALVRARSHLDRLEGIMTTAMAFRDAAQTEARRLEQAADDAWDDEANRAKGPGSRYEFEGARERYAAWNIKIRAQRNAARTARDCADIFASAEKVIQAMYRGLDSSRLDLHRRLTALAFLSSLES